ncbi:conserved hypothetical protein [Hyella patelloides LEGE 07179]|uniref:Tyrosine specific protein phosphatases domain-containing protein n=1 Tax=Hyella patelloides LEGE 07179 TaxID=945734 RepID=A0A563W4M8_9CYAN|nr:dual specificity protein phosphatase family protein [Hyella patelloides]VEP18483.1 conserved hypothetical protein [Hyella patelloides LEGE 07179]
MLDILVCGVDEVNDIINEVDGVISIMNPGDTVGAPQSITSKENKDRYSVLRFELEDVLAKQHQVGLKMATPKLISGALDFAHSFVERFGDDSCLLIHCHSGISRSSAVAVAIYTSLYENPKDAVARVSHQRPQAVPNLEIIRLTDNMLNMQGELYHSVSETFYFHF